MNSEEHVPHNGEIMDTQKVNEIEKLYHQLFAANHEVSILSRKKPNDAMNEFKLQYLNILIAKSNKILGKEYRPFDNFEKFDEDDLPSNSDVVFMISQYLKSFNRWKDHNLVL